MKSYEIRIEWSGPSSVSDVIKNMNRAGKPPTWDGEDYGLYQIYGEHTLCGKNTLLYIGIVTDRTFSQRFDEHKKEWLSKDQRKEAVRVYLGRVYDPKRYLTDEIWEEDIEIAEKILIYKYAPNYNSSGITAPPDLSPHKSIRLIHDGERGRLKPKDNAPKDFFV